MRQRKLGKPNLALKGKKRTPDAVAKMRAAALANPQRYWLGKKRDQATRDKIRAKKIGVKRTTPAEPAVIALWTNNMLRAAAARRKPVICLTDGRIFESAAAASAAYGFSKTAVASVCNPNRRDTTVYGLRFAYVDMQ